MVIAQIRRLKRAKIVPVAVGAFGCVSKKLVIWIEKLRADTDVAFLQKEALFEAARILKRALDT